MKLQIDVHSKCTGYINIYSMGGEEKKGLFFDLCVITGIASTKHSAEGTKKKNGGKKKQRARTVYNFSTTIISLVLMATQLFGNIRSEERRKANGGTGGVLGDKNSLPERNPPGLDG